MGKVLYLLVLKDFFGCIEYVLFWCKIFSTNLEGLGFEINPYYRCVAKN